MNNQHALPKALGRLQTATKRTTERCAASGDGWACARTPQSKARGLCSGHDQQQRRGKPFTPVLKSHGAKLGNTKAVLLRVPVGNDKRIRALATARGVTAQDVYRAAIDAFIRDTL